MEITRGDVVICVAPGDYGKPRPAVVVQSNLFNPTHQSLVVCPVTSELVDAPLFRIAVQPSAGNGLRKPSQVMVDKVIALRRDRIKRRAGTLGVGELARVDVALRLWLALSDTEDQSRVTPALR
jgi:mRNA interferase MazF